MMSEFAPDANVQSSFRDPSGFLFTLDGVIYRQVNTAYKGNYDRLISSSLYETLVNSGLLIPHEEVDISPARPDRSYKIIKPEQIEFISYPYEWCFSQLKDSALATLEMQKTALKCGMSLKDCSAYNMQFRKGRPVFIDTLSFEEYNKGVPWVAYRQFCQHFLAPLALMAYTDVRLGQLFRVFIDGVPLDLASRLLPRRTLLNFPLLIHIHLHAGSQKYFADKTLDKDKRSREFGKGSMLGLIDSLESAVKKLRWAFPRSEWGNYYEDTNYSSAAARHKKQTVAGFLERIGPKTAWDLGANTGVFSRIAADMGIQTVAFDVDPAAVEKNYLECVDKGETSLLPLLLDLTNPSSGIGWQNSERMSILERGPVEAAMALALVHHLAISNNLPLIKIAGFFKAICGSLIIEFVPKTDSQVRRLLSTREDIFPDYTQRSFETEFGRLFTIKDSVRIKDSERTLYLMAGS